MCTIDPMMCWYFDHKDYWISHPEEFAVAEEIINSKVKGGARFVSEYARKAKKLLSDK